MEHTSDYLLKDVRGLIMAVFGCIKSSELASSDFLGKAEHILKLIFFEVGSHTSVIRSSFMTGLDAISSKALKTFRDDKIVYHKVIGTIEIISKLANSLNKKFSYEDL